MPTERKDMADQPRALEMVSALSGYAGDPRPSNVDKPAHAQRPHATEPTSSGAESANVDRRVARQFTEPCAVPDQRIGVDIDSET